MKFKLNDKLKYFLVVLANYLLVLYACLSYRGGAFANMSYIPLQLGLAMLNYHFSKKVLSLVFLCVNFIASTALANYLSIYLYYKKISSDWGTGMLGIVIFIIGAGIAVLISLASIILKAVELWEDKKNAQEENERGDTAREENVGGV